MEKGESAVITTKKGDRYWEKTRLFARNCTWVAGPTLSGLMETCRFKDWERVFITVADEEVIGFSTLTEIDCIPETHYRPFIGFVFVGEPHRGKRLGAKMIDAIFDYAKEIGFKKLYVASNEIGLYQKMGFQLIDHQEDIWGKMEQIFVREVG